MRSGAKKMHCNVHCRHPITKGTLQERAIIQLSFAHQLIRWLVICFICTRPSSLAAFLYCWTRGTLVIIRTNLFSFFSKRPFVSNSICRVICGLFVNGILNLIIIIIIIIINIIIIFIIIIVVSIEISQQWIVYWAQMSQAFPVISTKSKPQSTHSYHPHRQQTHWLTF